MLNKSLYYKVQELKLSEIGDLELIIVGNRFSETFKIWKEMMNKYHPLEAGPLFGKRLYYLVKSSKLGYIAGLSFSSSAYRLESRDKWIGWDEIDRKKNLQRIVNNSRFLIDSTYRVPNLGSRIFSLCMKRFRNDWKAKHNIDPLLLESFVDTESFDGALYKASNWQYLGKTKGRGRQDRKNEHKLSIKDVYVYPLDRKCREQLSSTTTDRRKTFKPLDWIEEEFHHVNFNDNRLKNRLYKIARSFYSEPEDGICEVNNGDWGATKATYRFFSNDKVTMQEILDSHRQSTVKRISKEEVVLLAQDTTSLNYSNLIKTKGLGLIDSKRTKAKGFIMHDTMAFTEEGVPLGLLDIQIWSRDEKEYGKSKLRKKKAIEEKESYKWLKSFKAAESIKSSCPQSKLISIGDREADIYELFELAFPSSVELLVRASHNRKLYNEQEKLWDKLQKAKERGILEVNIPPKDGQKSRKAKLSIRYSKVILNPPSGKRGVISINAVKAQEVDVPPGIKGIEWRLLTTLDIENFHQACKVIDYYSKRWGIEVYHKILKSGCKVENRRFSEDKRILSCLAVDLVIGWKIYYITKVSREKPNASCEVILKENEWKVLMLYSKKKANFHSDIKRGNANDCKIRRFSWAKR